jgi:signal transduction histidine kinase
MLESPLTLATRLRRSAFAFPLVALAGLAMLLISELSYHRANGSMDSLGALGQARSSLQELQRHMLDAETGQRGYLLTGRKEYLTPYREANEEIDTTLQRLREHFAAQNQAGELDRLVLLVQRRMSELQTALMLHDEGREEAWRALLETDIGKEQMDQIRAISQQLLAEETRKVSIGRKDVYDTLLLNRIGVGAMTALSLLALFMYLRQTAALEAQREEQRFAIQAERDHLEAQVKRRTSQLTELAQHLQTAREDERSRLARELHDELGALLTAAKLDAARLRSRIANVAPEALERLNHLSEILNSGIALKRRIIEDLRPSALSNLGLVAALEILTREHAERSGQQIDAHFDKVALTPAAELTIYRMVQEALTNISKYAQARKVRIRVNAEDDGVRVIVEDDGIGFDRGAANPSSHGLVGMRYRVEAEGGRLDIESAPGRGTQLRAWMPAAKSAALAAA